MNAESISQKEKSHFLVRKARTLFKELFRNRVLYLMILPAILFFIIFSYAPMAGVIAAFKRFNYNDGLYGSPWCGMENFRFLWKSGTLMKITVNTVLYNVVFIGLGVVTQVGMALMLNEIGSKLFKKTAQTMMFMPYFISYVILSVFVYNIFNYDNGLLNNLLQSMGLEKFSAYTTTWIWKYVLVFFQQWKELGYGVVIYLAAITGISDEYYEAARIDGASHWQEIKYISLPMLKPTIITIVLFAVGRIMKGQFELFYQIIGTNGVLYNSTDIIDTYVFRSLTQTFDVGMGTAAGLYQSLFGLILILTVNGIIKRINADYALF